MRVLLIEDDTSIGYLIRSVFERERYEVTLATTAEEGLQLLDAWNPELVILDIGLPDRDGREVLKEIRTTSDVPVVIVSAFGDESSRVVGLELGSDDYIVKPFSVTELVARARAVTRRARPKGEIAADRLAHGDLRMDVSTHRVFQGAKEIELTNIEFRVLRELLENGGAVVSRSDLARTVWGLSAVDATRSIDVCISAIRHKLGDPPTEPRYIETVRGVGFRMGAP